MNAVSAALIPKILAGGSSRYAMTEAALILAGAVSGDMTDPAVQDAVNDVLASAAGNENPSMWVAILLVDLVTQINNLSAAVTAGSGGTKISDLPALTDPVDAAAVLPLVQGGITSKVTPSQLAEAPYGSFVKAFHNLDMSAAVAIPLWTVPAGRIFMFTGATIRITSVDGAIGSPPLSWRIVNSADLALGGGGLVAATFDAVDEINFNLDTNSAFKIAAANTGVKFLVLDTAPVHVSAYVRGFYAEA